jgi:cation-transporting P-type ATPase E
MNLFKYKDVIITHVFNRLNIVVFIFSFLLLFIGRYSEATISASIVIFNILIAIYQEIRAKQQLEKLSFNNDNVYTITRTDNKLTLKQDDIIIDDIVEVGIGLQIPIDGAVTTGFIQVDESFMTGESDLIAKNIGDNVYAGSNIFSGQATLTTTHSYHDSRVKSLEKKGKVYGIKYTPIELKINSLISIILIFIGCFIAFASLYLFLNKTSYDQIIIVNSVISGLVPSTLLAMVTIVNSWSIAKTFLNKENLLPQKLNAYESLANVDVFCFDKTGTLTTNNIEFVGFVANKQECSDEEFSRYSGIYSHNITSHTKSSELIKTNFSYDKQYKVLDDVPFNSATKVSHLIYQDGDDIVELILGAPEKLIPLDSPFHSKVQLEQLQGNRILVMAIKKNHGLEHVMGYYILKEELRKEIANVFNQLNSEGKQYKIISGDNPISIMAVANSLGLGIKKEEVISGYDIQHMPREVLEKKVDSIKIFGRMTPEDKELIITILKKHHYVAMVGDGVNDLLPIKKANLGIVLQSGASATRLASDLILLNDDYSSLLSCIKYGKVNKFILNAIYGIFYTRFIYLSVIYLTLVLVFRNLPFSVIHTSLISLLSVGLGVIMLFNVVYKYQIDWKTLNKIEFIIPASFLTVTLALGLVYNMIRVGIKLRDIATSLVVFLVFCALGVNLLSIIPTKTDLSWNNIKHVLYLFGTQVFIFCLLIFLINFEPSRNLWKLTRLNLSEYIRLFFFASFWIFGFLMIYFFDNKIRTVLSHAHNTAKDLINVTKV